MVPTMVRTEAGESESGPRAAKPTAATRLALIPALLLLPLAWSPGGRSGCQERPEPSSLLAAVVSEVKELGRRPGEDFYRWEFFLGEDDDDTNKDVHAVVIIHDDPPPLRLRVHVTDFERRPDNRRVRIARQTRVIFAAASGDRLAVEKSDFAEKEIVPVLQSLLKAIRDKKKLLRKAAEIRLY